MMKKSEQGFTLIELIVYITLTVMFTVLVFTFMLDFWSGAATLENDSETFVTRENAGDKLRDALNVTSGLITQNSITDSHVDASVGSGNYWSVIHAIPGTTTLPAA